MTIKENMLCAKTSFFSFLLFSLLFFICLSANTYAQLPAGFSDELVRDSWDGLTGITFDAEGRAYAWSRTGRLFQADGGGNWQPEPVVDISEEVANWWDMGMLGFTLNPNFLENGRCYFFYVVDRHHLLHFGTPEYDPETTTLNEATIGRITRYSLDPATGFSTAVPGSRKVLVGETISTGFPMIFKTHGVGSLAFGTDGTLLATCGETGHPEWAETGSTPSTYFAQALIDDILRPAENVGAFRSQVVNSLGGKVVRLDPETGDGLPSNPFFDPANPRAARSRVWHWGCETLIVLRCSPIRAAIFRATGAPAICSSEMSAPIFGKS